MSADVLVVLCFLVLIAIFVYKVRAQIAVFGEEFDEFAGEVVPANFKANAISQNIYQNRKGTRARVGVLYSCNKNDKVRIGFSLCCKEDKFDIREAKKVAGQRMGEKSFVVPPSIVKDVDRFLERCERYYKNSELPVFDGHRVIN